MVDPKILETFPNPAPVRDYVIEHTHHEFTSLCPMTGHPDFADITVRYVPDKVCVELKSLKLYFHAFRNEGSFFEAVTNTICDDLGRAMKPRSLTVVSRWKARGGFTSIVTAEWSAKGGRAKRPR
ncbi:7-cyano-7-deazaguanine reductase [Ereboglobus sp. PH5-5]|uniref:preQ(1) synthase n=1 Tax=unclassified Ereboglobus TaxID=2626932 RepID=UPI0024068796|nr:MULTISPECIES: preQ(1) synthase [unclassified Ereboglobus]MDF9828469.1 7-cyano-7-deazaguanine reductase [Ereboglobus sp. PH5-10]MDF9833610.1 7-cyano-7-deazaguanine reductase [Ereboglobus sp. PH5-5]